MRKPRREESSLENAAVEDRLFTSLATALSSVPWRSEWPGSRGLPCRRPEPRREGPPPAFCGEWRTRGRLLPFVRRGLALWPSCSGSWGRRELASPQFQAAQPLPHSVSGLPAPIPGRRKLPRTRVEGSGALVVVDGARFIAGRGSNLSGSPPHRILGSILSSSSNPLGFLYLRGSRIRPGQQDAAEAEVDPGQRRIGFQNLAYSAAAASQFPCCSSVSAASSWA